MLLTRDDYGIYLCMSRHYSIVDFNRDFKTEAACLEAVFCARFDRLDICPSCMRQSKFSRVKKRKCYSCQWCGHQIYPLAGTIFHKSRTPLKKWFFAIYLFSVSKNGVSSLELHRQLRVTEKCAWRMAKQIRTLFFEEVTDQFKGIVEADEAFFGGKRPTKHKTPVLGIRERTGRVRTKVVVDTQMTTIVPFITRNVTLGTHLMTDEYLSYVRLRRMGYEHSTVRHKDFQWAVGDTTTNRIEGHWGWVKRSISGSYVSVSEKYLSSYLDEFSWRQNHQGENWFPLLLAEASKPLRLTP